ncbi:MAG: UDP binding domain-containing protein [Vicinamibacterales bacterium]
MRDAHVIGFAGLSHLGIVSSIAAAAKGLEVVAFDPDATLTAALARGELPLLEPGLAELLLQHRGRVRLASDPAALAACDVVFFSIDIPTDDSNRSDLAPLDRLIDATRGVVLQRATLVVLSQVPPGFTRSRGLHHCQVETLVFGQAVERALHPERIIVGCPDPAAPLPAAYAEYVRRFECPVLPMRLESAELAKIAINMLLVSSVSTTNMLAELCEGVGAEWGEIAPALRLDRRIGPHAYLTPGLGLSGGNLERDLATVQRLAGEHGADAQVVEAWLGQSARRRGWALRCLQHEDLVRPGAAIAVWGLAYKPDTASTRNSPALPLLDALSSAHVTAYDPAARLDESRFPHVRRAEAPLPACAGADALVVMTPWRDLACVDLGAVASAMRGRVLVDPFGAIDAAAAARLGFTHYRLGSPAPRAVSRRRC